MSKSHFSKKTPLRDTPQIPRGNEPERGVRVGNHVRQLVATEHSSGWQIPSWFLGVVAQMSFVEEAIKRESVLAKWCGQLRRRKRVYRPRCHASCLRRSVAPGAYCFVIVLGTNVFPSGAEAEVPARIWPARGVDERIPTGDPPVERPTTREPDCSVRLDAAEKA